MVLSKWESLQPDPENYNWHVGYVLVVHSGLQPVACGLYIEIMPASGWAIVRCCSVKLSIRGRSAGIRVMGLFCNYFCDV